MEGASVGYWKNTVSFRRKLTGTKYQEGILFPRPLQSRVGCLKKSRRLLTRHPWLGIDWQGREKLKEEKIYSRPFTLGKEEKRPCHPELDSVSVPPYAH